MDFILTAEQQARIDATKAALTAAGPEGALDANNLERLRNAGLIEPVAGGSLLGQALIVEEVSRAGVLAPVGSRMLVLPLFPELDARVVALADGDGPVRFGMEADLLIRLEGERARAYQLAPGTARPFRSNYVYGFGIPAAGTAVAEADASAVRRRWRIALAAEAVGAMDAALATLVAYLGVREQFGRKLGSFQALHHRVAELAVLLEAGRWLAREAADRDDEETAALAALHVAKAARRYAWDAHQLAGARGFTLELGLHRHTLRLQTLSMELGGPLAHAKDAAALAWAEPA